MVDVTVKVTAVREQELPGLDDEFAQTASEFDTVAELKDDVRDRLVRAARVEQAAAARDAVLEKLLTMVDVPLPDGAVADELKSRRDAINEQLVYAGMSEADYLESEGQTEDEFAVDLEKRVRDAMTAQFLLDEIATAEAVGVDEGELTQHLLRRAQQSGQTPEEYVKHVMEHNHVPELVAEIRRGKALAHVLESATVKDASGNVVELRTLLPDGTYGDPDELAAEADDADAGSQSSAGTTAPAPNASADLQVLGSTDFVQVAEPAEPQEAQADKG
jgi:trigger factor